jgi:aryl-alcohol dehydrogenase-like predicted oxidoreductase
LGRGFLTGAINANTKFYSNDFRNNIPRFSEENRKYNQVLVDLLGKIATDKNATPARIALGGKIKLNDQNVSVKSGRLF